MAGPLPHGKGIMTYADGNKYEGHWKNGKKHGLGTYTDADGQKYPEKWKDANYRPYYC